jgi:hypothetical protein
MRHALEHGRILGAGCSGGPSEPDGGWWCGAQAGWQSVRNILINGVTASARPAVAEGGEYVQPLADAAGVLA